MCSAIRRQRGVVVEWWVGLVSYLEVKGARASGVDVADGGLLVEAVELERKMSIYVSYHEASRGLQSSWAFGKRGAAYLQKLLIVWLGGELVVDSVNGSLEFDRVGHCACRYLVGR